MSAGEGLPSNGTGETEMKKVKKNKNAKGKRLMVVAVRHFSNNEHHWLAPEDMEEAQAFAENGTVEENVYGMPVFSLLKEAEHFAFSQANGETVLAQWESSRPTYMVVEEEVYLAVVEQYSYDYPEDAEEWSDAMVADFVRKCDCEEFVRKRLWDSNSDMETEYAKERGYCADEE